ncbi:MAG: lactonase family protein [Bacteroidales bacterium]|nr:lactonase family protein [Bacteroidales bacterium]
MRVAGKIFCLVAASFLLSCSQASAPVTMLVGTYSSEDGGGIYAFRFDQQTGKVLPGVQGHADLRDASYLMLSGDGARVYAVSERPDSTAALAAFSFDQEGLTFSHLGTAPTLGEDPCFVETNGRIAVTANYSGGSISVFRLDDNGGLKDAKPFQVIHGTVGGPDESRQGTPHEHCTVFTPDGEYLLASDFSADRIVSYSVAGDSLKEYSDVRLENDYGPRHIIFRDGKTAYVIGELSGKITVLDYSEGVLIPVQVVDCDPVHARGSADIRMTPDCRFLYASNRLENDGVAVFKVNGDGTLEQTSYTQTGIHPRNICVSPDGRLLLVACRDSDRIEVYSINQEDGRLEKAAEDIRVPKPVCIKFIQ